MRVLVTGTGGLVGSAVASLASKRHEVFSAFNRHPPRDGVPVRLDLLDKEEIGSVVRRTKPEVVIHAAALTDVDRCEREQRLAERVNHEATEALSKAARAVGAYLLFISTDYVFDGARGMYKEGDPTNPVCFYGLTKLRGEESVLASGADSGIARGSVIYGPRPAAGKANFALWLIDSLRGGRRAQVLDDQFVSPTLSLSMAEMALEVAERRVPGKFHLSGASRKSRYEFACAVSDAFGLDSSLIDRVGMDEMHWLARRPRDSSLDVSKASASLASHPLALADSLERLKAAMAGPGA